MKNAILLSAYFFAAQVLAGILPVQANLNDEVKLLPKDFQDLLSYEYQLDDWNDFLAKLDASGAVNLNIYSEYHRKSKRFNGATLGVDMEINEIAIFYMEENLSSPY